jgi:divalent metal cation (Fe/Co/Zn/Cd) transporter
MGINENTGNLLQPQKRPNNIFDSEVLIADAFHSGADLLVIFTSWFGLWLASRKKTQKSPYGLYKAETLVTLIVEALIAWAGILLAYFRIPYSV